jgi:uncharacterized alkaline shock family protein YloU
MTDLSICLTDVAMADTGDDRVQIKVNLDVYYTKNVSSNWKQIKIEIYSACCSLTTFERIHCN